MGLIIGLTGGIGSGKTFISHIFSEMGVPVYNSDERAKQLMLGPKIRSNLTEAFGPKTYKNNELNRAYLASLIFNNKEALQRMNAIVHPIVGQDFIDWSKANENAPFVLKESDNSVLTI